MSYAGAIPVDTDEGETALLVEDCLARVRAEVGLLEEGSVLRPVEALLREDEPTRLFVAPSARNGSSTASPTAKRGPFARTVGATAEASARAGATVPSPFARDLPTVLTHKKSTLPSRPLGDRKPWLFFACCFVAGVFGGIAVMMSPVGNRPLLRRVINEASNAKSHVLDAYAAVRAARSRLMNP